MKELIQEFFSPGKCRRGGYFDKEGGDKLCCCEDEEQSKGPLQSQSCVLCVVTILPDDTLGLVQELVCIQEELGN